MKILIVEDDRLMARDLAGQLSKLGYSEVRLTSNAEEACSQYRKDPPQILIVDIKLGRDSVDGITLAADLALLGSHGLIYLTGYPEEAKSLRAQALHPAATLIKPVHAKQLKAALDIAAAVKSKPPQPIPLQLYQSQRKIQAPQLVRGIVHPGRPIQRNYSHPEDQRICYSKSLKHIWDQIPYTGLERVHRSYIVNLHRVSAFDDHDLYIEAADKTHTIPYTSTYRDVIYRRLHRMLTN